VLNPFQEINWRPDRRARRKFAASLVVGFPCAALIILLVQRWHAGTWEFATAPALTLGGTGAALGIVFYLVPQIARPSYVAWHGAAGAIGFVVGNAVLVAFYLLLFAPTGLVRRALGRRAFAKTFDRAAPTYWRVAPPPDAPARYYRQF
jgi:hypothetical protein